MPLSVQKVHFVPLHFPLLLYFAIPHHIFIRSHLLTYTCLTHNHIFPFLLFNSCLSLHQFIRSLQFQILNLCFDGLQDLLRIPLTTFSAFAWRRFQTLLSSLSIPFLLSNFTNLFVLSFFFSLYIISFSCLFRFWFCNITKIMCSSFYYRLKFVDWTSPSIISGTYHFLFHALSSLSR